MEKYLVTVKSLVKNEDGTVNSDRAVIVPHDRLEAFVSETVNQDSICIVAASLEEYV